MPVADEATGAFLFDRSFSGTNSRLAPRSGHRSERRRASDDELPLSLYSGRAGTNGISPRASPRVSSLLLFVSFGFPFRPYAFERTGFTGHNRLANRVRFGSKSNPGDPGRSRSPGLETGSLILSWRVLRGSWRRCQRGPRGVGLGNAPQTRHLQNGLFAPE